MAGDFGGNFSLLIAEGGLVAISGTKPGIGTGLAPDSGEGRESVCRFLDATTDEVAGVLAVAS